MTRTRFTPKLVSKFVMVTNLVLVLPRLSARAHFYEQLAMVVGRARLPWEFLIHNYIGEQLCTNLCRLCRLCDRRHTFTAHSATVISKGVSPMWRCVVSRCSRQCLTILVHIPNHFIAPTVFSSLLMSSNSPSPLSLLCALNFLHHPPIGSGRVPPVFSSLRLLATPFYASRTIEPPHSVAQTPILAELPRVR